MIVFEQPTVRVTISNKQPYVHTFRGFNHFSVPVHITKTTKGCSCTSTVIPSKIEPNSYFEVQMTVDKTGQTGYFSTSITLEFDLGNAQKLKINGQLES
jgi:hypothetical protein